MAYQQLHAGKVKFNGLVGIQHHLLDRNRVKTNPDIDLSRSDLNYSVEGLTADHLAKRVNQRIKNLNLKRKPRFDAVAIEDIIIGASSDFMLQLGAEQQEKYFAEALHFFQNRYGKENVMYCQCHLDESNPHIHVGIVPVTKDGRLSARDVFNPKSLEKLQTDFHRAVASHYGLERGEHHAKTYLELNKYKAQQAKLQIQQFTEDLNTAVLQQSQIDDIQKSARFKSNGLLFKSANKDIIELPTHNFLLLKQMAEQGIKISAKFQLLAEQNKQLQHDNFKLSADYEFLTQQFQHLQDKATPYTQIPDFWRKKVDTSIAFWQKSAIAYWHDLHRATVRVFIATHGNFDKTVAIMQPLFDNLPIAYPKKYVKRIVSAAVQQFQSRSLPSAYMSSWKPPKPEETDYRKADESGIVPLQLANVPDIDWNLINWDLLSELDKDDIRHKQIQRSL